MGLVTRLGGEVTEKAPVSWATLGGASVVNTPHAGVCLVSQVQLTRVPSAAGDQGSQVSRNCVTFRNLKYVPQGRADNETVITFLKSEGTSEITYTIPTFFR